MELRNQFVGCLVINVHSIVLAAGDDDRQVWVENHAANVLGLASGLVEGVQAGSCLVVPNLNYALVIARDQVRLLLVTAKVQTIHSDLVT